MTTQQPEALRLAHVFDHPIPPEWSDMVAAAAELRRQHARITELEDACRTNIENYQFQRSKADRATATVYQFHYAMKDAGWHPGRTDDDLTQIIRAKGGELASATRHLTELEAQLAQRFDAADIATAAAQGFRDGVASVSRLTDPQIASACMSYRHDFGLLDDAYKEQLVYEARSWEHAFAKEREWAAADGESNG